MTEVFSGKLIFEEAPRLISRSKNEIQLTIKLEPGVEYYELWGHRTIDGCVSAADFICRFKEEGFVSKSLIKQNSAVWTASNQRTGQKTIHVNINMNDFKNTPNNLPTDEEVLYLRLRKYYTAAAALTTAEPIFVIPNYRFYMVEDPIITLYANAPGISAVPGTTADETSLRIYLPGYGKVLYLTNFSDTINLCLSFDEGMSYTLVKNSFVSGGGFDFAGGFAKFILASTTGDPVPVALKATMVRGYKEKF